MSPPSQQYGHISDKDKHPSVTNTSPPTSSPLETMAPSKDFSSESKSLSLQPSLKSTTSGSQTTVKENPVVFEKDHVMAIESTISGAVAGLVSRYILYIYEVYQEDVSDSIFCSFFSLYLCTYLSWPLFLLCNKKKY